MKARRDQSSPYRSRSPLILFMRVLFALVTSLSLVYGQDHPSTRWTAGVSYVLPGGDFGSYWNNAPGVTAGLLLQLEPPFFLQGSAGYGRFTVKNSAKGNLPTIALVSINTDLLARPGSAGWLQAAFGAGIGAYTLFYSGVDQTVLQGNDIESEVGFRIVGSLSVPVTEGLETVVSASWNTVLTLPRRIHLWEFSAGVRF